MTERADQLHHHNRPAHSTALVQTSFFTKHYITQVCHLPLQPRFVSLRPITFPKAKIAIERKEICEYDGHTVHKLSQRRLTADWLTPRENDCSWVHSKVSSDWLPSYIKATLSVLEIFKMAGCFPDSPRTNLFSPKPLSWSIFAPHWRVIQLFETHKFRVYLFFPWIYLFLKRFIC